MISTLIKSLMSCMMMNIYVKKTLLNYTFIILSTHYSLYIYGVLVTYKIASYTSLISSRPDGKLNSLVYSCSRSIIVASIVVTLHRCSRSIVIIPVVVIIITITFNASCRCIVVSIIIIVISVTVLLAPCP